MREQDVGQLQALSVDRREHGLDRPARVDEDTLAAREIAHEVGVRVPEGGVRDALKQDLADDVGRPGLRLRRQSRPRSQ